MTRRKPSKPLPSNSPAANSSAPEIEVPRIVRKGAPASARATLSAAAASSTSVQGTITDCAPGPPHSK